MKNKKLKLEHLKVKSFVTSMEKTEKQTINGGVDLYLEGDPDLAEVEARRLGGGMNIMLIGGAIKLPNGHICF